MHFDYLIIGGGVAGTTAAEIIRKHDPQGSMGIVSEEPHLLYSRVLLPHFVKGIIPEEKIFLRNRQWYESHHIELLSGRIAINVNTKDRTVAFDDSTVLSFRKLLIATGGSPRPWNGGKHPEHGIYRLQTLEDAEVLKAALPSIRQAVIVGGGFIGLEFAGIFARANIDTTMLILNPWYWYNTLSEQEGALVHARLALHNIHSAVGDEVEEVLGYDTVEGVRTQRGKAMPCDAIGVGIGLDPNVKFLQGSGIAVGGRGIRTNEYFETSVPDVFAAGDVAEFFDAGSGRHRRLGNWTNAVQQGRVVGATMAGVKTAMTGVSSYSSTVFSDLAITFTGDIGMSAGSDEEIRRYDHAKGSLGRLLLKEKTIVGAILINRPQDAAPISKLIETKKQIPQVRDLENPNVDLKTLL